MESTFFTTENIETILGVGGLVILGIPASFYLGKVTNRFVAKKLNAQRGMIAGKFVQYLLFIAVVVICFNQLGFSLTPLLGAAGIAGIAIGFASQTSVSNIISGFFLIGEKPFSVGDTIIVGDTTGTVLSVDILSVKLRTVDNRYVRIPNEVIIKSQIINVTRFPIRRLDIKVTIAYKEDIKRVREVLLDIASENPECLREPEPQVIFSGFGDSSIELLFAVWASRENFVKLKNSIQEDIKEGFDKYEIEIPFPHLSLYAGSKTNPIPIKLVSND